jgi:hypothetical protein
VDFEGNWKWGRFYYNVSFPLQTLSGCQFDAAGAFILSGRLDDKPVIVELNTTTGHVNRFFQLDAILEDGATAPWFRTYYGIHHEVNENDYSYFYLSFIMDDKLNVIKFRDEPDTSVTPNTHPIEWNYEYQYVFNGDEADTWKNKKSARFLHVDNRDPSKMFLMGRLYGRATVIKFNTRSFSRDYMLQIHDRDWATPEIVDDENKAASPMHDIVSIVQPTNMDAIFACGYGFLDGTSESVQKVATVFKMSTEGYMYFMKSWGTPVLDDNDSSPDVCRSVTYDYANDQVVFLLETMSEELRPDYDTYKDWSYKNADLMVITMNQDGTLKQAVNLNFDAAAITFGIAEQSLFIHDNKLVFGGQSYGFLTKFQNQTYEPAAPYNDAFLFNMDLSQSSSCFFTKTFNRNGIEAVTYDYGETAPQFSVSIPPIYIAETCTDVNWDKLDVNDNPCCPCQIEVADGGAMTGDDIIRNTFGGDLTDWYTKYTDDEIVGAVPPHEVYWESPSQFVIYSNRYCQGFDLLDILYSSGDIEKYPRMCAAETANLTNGLTYYLGENEKAYHVGVESDKASVVSRMDSGVEWVFDNGTDASTVLGRYSEGYGAGGSVYVYTHSEDAVGKHRTILRGCSNHNELLELYLYVNVLANTFPDFVTTVQTNWKLSVSNETTTYKLPDLVDNQGNDEPELWITETEGKIFPEQFMMFDNSTNTLSWIPDSIWYQGEVYYFDIIVKEKNSDGVWYAYHAMVEIEGEKIDPKLDLNYTDIDYELDTLERASTGAIKFNHPVNLSFVAANFYDLFDVYVKNNTWVTHNQTMEVKDFIITDLGDDGRTLNFTVVFDKPYMLGLLVKKNDRLYVHLKYYLLDTYGFFKPEYNEMGGNISWMFLGNRSLTRMFADRCEKDRDENVLHALGSTEYRETIYAQTVIPLLFDMTNDLMSFWRSYAINTYWYLLGFVLLQFCALAYRGVGYFPLWMMIEYM